MAMDNELVVMALFPRLVDMLRRSDRNDSNRRGEHDDTSEPGHQHAVDVTGFAALYAPPRPAGAAGAAG